MNRRYTYQHIEVKRGLRVYSTFVPFVETYIYTSPYMRHVDATLFPVSTHAI
jgi:hypothetical protein